MDAAQFEAVLADLTIIDIHAIAADLDSARSSPADEIDATRATLAVEHALRGRRLHTDAAVAARAVGMTVQDAARRERVTLPDDAVTRVARAAGQIARAMVAGSAVTAELSVLLRGFERVVDCAEVALSGYGPAPCPTPTVSSSGPDRRIRIRR
ncbi:MAG: hypothetical protein ACT4OX_11270 [Actinomycetota bacterium]